MSASPAPSYRSNPGTPPRTAQPTEPSNPFSTPYTPRYFEHTPNGSIHRPSSRASTPTRTPTRFSSISPRKLPPPPAFPDLRTISPLNSPIAIDIPDDLGPDEGDMEADEDDGEDRESRSDFGYIFGMDPSRSNSPNSFEDDEYLEEKLQDEYDEDLEGDTRHYGPAPTQSQPRRHKAAMAKRQVQLVQGNLVLDNPVPSKLTSFLPRRDAEFTHMRYTAATCDPDD